MGFYEDFEDKYYDFLDSLDRAGVNLYPFTDWIEDQGIPSMPVMILLALLLFGGVLFAIALALGVQVFPSTTLTYVITVLDGDAPVEGVSVSLQLAGQRVTGDTDSDGVITLRTQFAAGEEPLLTLEKEGYASKEEALDALDQAPSEAIEKTVELEKESVGFTTDALTTIIIKQPGEEDVVLACEYTCDIPFIEGAEYYDACGNKLSPKGGHVSCSSTLSLQGSGTVAVTVVDESTFAPVSGASVKVLSDFRRVKEGTTNSNGVVNLTGIPTGLYSVTVSAANYVTKTVSTPPLSIKDGELSSATIALQKTGKLPDGTPAVFNVTVADSNGLVLQGAVIAYAPVSQPSNSATVTTDGAGKASFNALNQSYNLTISRPNYITLNENNKTPGTYSFTLTKVGEGNTNTLEVTVKNSDGSKAALAEVRIVKIIGGSESFAGMTKYTDSSGTAVFNGFDLNVDYKARAVKGSESAVSTVIRFTSPTQTLTGTLTLSTTPVACDNDGSCDSGEPSNCADCNAPTNCNSNGSCNSGETATTCPNDCPITSTCNNNGTCNSNESISTCPHDCTTGTGGDDGGSPGGSEGSFSSGSGSPVPFAKTSVNWAHSDTGYSYTGTN